MRLSHRRKMHLSLLSAVLIVCPALRAEEQPARMDPGIRGSRNAGQARMVAPRSGRSLLFEDITVFDEDGDGVLSRKEFEDAASEMFQVLDRNADGRIESEEMTRTPAAIWADPPVRARQILRLYDIDGDGKIVIAECLLPQAVFAKIDRDNSGAIENDDLLKLNLSHVALLVNPERRATLLIAEFDKNKNGQLDADELAAAGPAMTKADTNGDGIIDKDELQSLPPLAPDHPRRLAEELIARSDQDGDNMLAENEFRRTRVPFDLVDTNKDGLADVKELTVWYESGAGRRTQAFAATQMAENIMSRFDKNGDGKITEDERQNMPERMWTRWDANGDGVVDAKEIEESVTRPRTNPIRPRELGGEGMPGPRGGAQGRDPAAIVKIRDRNNDGKLSAAESGMDPRIFGRMDTDGDGQLTGEEINAGLGQIRNRTDQTGKRPADAGEKGTGKGNP